VALCLAAWSCSDDPAPQDAGGDTGVDGGGDVGGDAAADATPDAQGDTGADVADLAPDLPAGVFGEEEGDWTDCISGCPNDDNTLLIDLRNFPLDGVRGTIDGEEHRYTVNGIPVTLGDIDILGVQAEARTMIEVIVEAEGRNNPLDPLVRTFDGFVEMSFNSDAGPGTTRARTVVANPYLAGELPFYVVVEDAVNYEARSGGGGAIRGGDEFTYRVRFETSDFSPVELGELTAGAPLEATGQVVEQPGDLRYFRFEAPATASFRVDIERSGGDSDGFLLYAAGTRTIGGQLVFVGPTTSEDPESPEGSVRLEASDFRVCDEACEGEVGEFIFAVSDFNGEGGSAFIYDVTVTLE
jgi:hypothetical protein